MNHAPVQSLFLHRFRSMGCPCEIKTYAEDRMQAHAAFSAAEAEAHRLDRKYSHYRSDSQLAWLLGEATQSEGVCVDPETAALLNFSSTQFSESRERFDITAGRLSALWDRARAIPSGAQIKGALRSTGWKKVQWDGKRLKLLPGMKLDLGGIVKEYAADRAALLLKTAGLCSAYVDLGGDLHVLGPHPDGRPWRVGIANPRGSGACAYLEVHQGGLASSGDYERYSMIDGRRYSHIINPIDGWPVRGLACVSVTAPSCLLAGAVSTLAMLKGCLPGLELLETSGLSWLAHDGKKLSMSY